MLNVIMKGFMGITVNIEELKKMIRRHEGLRLSPYPCSKNHKTLGYGWNLDAHKLPRSMDAYLNVNGEITEAMAERLLDISLDTAIRQAWAIFPQFGGYTERRQMALIDFLFNVGAGTALTFKKALAAIYKGDWETAADEMTDSRWYRQVKSRGREIVEMIRKG